MTSKSASWREEMDELLAKIEEVVNFKGGKTIFECRSVADELTELMSSFELKPENWNKFVHFDKFKYTRNLIANGKDSRFGLMILAWGPGQQSPIHNHNGSHCIMRVLEGTLTEKLYTRSLDEAAMESDLSFSETITPDESEFYEKTRETELKSGQTAYIHDKIGWHRVSNSSTEHSAVSLHLYAPPIERCKTYCDVEGKVRAQAACPYFSINGEIVKNTTSK